MTIVTDYANAAPEEIETLITRVVEEAIGSVAGLKRIESVSREGRSTITASFNWGQDIDFAAILFAIYSGFGATPASAWQETYLHCGSARTAFCALCGSADEYRCLC